VFRMPEHCLFRMPERYRSRDRNTYRSRIVNTAVHETGTFFSGALPRRG
jgi:hypothetical protein